MLIKFKNLVVSTQGIVCVRVTKGRNIVKLTFGQMLGELRKPGIFQISKFCAYFTKTSTTTTTANPDT